MGVTITQMNNSYKTTLLEQKSFSFSCIRHHKSLYFKI